KDWHYEPIAWHERLGPSNETFMDDFFDISVRLRRNRDFAATRKKQSRIAVVFCPRHESVGDVRKGSRLSTRVDESTDVAKAIRVVFFNGITGAF
ncbi:MAG: hypothetical protein AAF664_23110, partial [Planctomycetota bacterium]